MIKQSILIALTALAIVSCKHSDSKKTSSQSESKTQIDSLLDELNNKFTLNGQPINTKGYSRPNWWRF
jgi:hypothetical protein